MAGNKIVIRKKSVKIALKTPKPVIYKAKNNFTLSGFVQDIKSGESLPFASLKIKGTENGTTSNVDGYFTLFNVPSDTSQLLIIYMGYKQK